MIEITTGTTEERIIKILQKKYPVTVNYIKNQLHTSKGIVLRELQKLQTKGIVRLEPLSEKIFIRLLRHDFSFVGKKRQRKFIKHSKKNPPPPTEEYDGIMYS
jgi:hypothetical protein